MQVAVSHDPLEVTTVCRYDDDSYHRCEDSLRRFWAKVNKTDTCWIWTACLGRGNYGRFSPHKGHTPVQAHRYAYEALVGPIPDGLQVDHLCHTLSDCTGGDTCPHRRCVNPAHLEPVTHRENQLRGRTFIARASQQTLCVNGHPLDATQHGGTRRRCSTCSRRRTREYMRRWRYARSDARAAERARLGLPPDPRRGRYRATPEA